MKSRLEHSIFYLAGPMDRIPDRGVEWREDICEFLWKLGAGAFNPCCKPMNWGVEDENSRNWRDESLKRAEQLYLAGHNHEAHKICEAVHENMRDVVASDLRGVDKCDALILYVDIDYHACGSYNEQATACLQRKPVVVCCKQGKYRVPHWLWGICQHEMFFGNWDEVKEYLKHVAYAESPNHLRRWRFLDQDVIFGREGLSTEEDKLVTNISRLIHRLEIGQIDEDLFYDSVNQLVRERHNERI